MSDARKVMEGVREFLAADGFAGPLFIMGRSLGTHSAAEIAAYYPDDLAGFISESGASGVARMAAALTSAGQGAAAAELAERHEAKLQSIRVPVLVMHGEYDELIPLETALGFYQTLQAEKEMVIIPGAGHNDIMWVGLQQYFGALRDFIKAHSS